MFGLREAGVIGASVAVAGGVAYLIWSYVSDSGRQKPGAPPGEQDGTPCGEKERVVPAEEAVTAVEDQKTSAVTFMFL